MRSERVLSATVNRMACSPTAIMLVVPTLPSEYALTKAAPAAGVRSRPFPAGAAGMRSMSLLAVAAITWLGTVRRDAALRAGGIAAAALVSLLMASSFATVGMNSGTVKSGTGPDEEVVVMVVFGVGNDDVPVICPLPFATRLTT
jgi:hypothetical protein